jgi:hypothetical protein
METSSNVIDISGVMEFVRVFRESAFDAQPVAAQAEILKNRIRRISVRENGIYVEIYGRSPEPVLIVLDEKKAQKNLAQSPAGSRPGVRAVSNLVDANQVKSNHKRCLAYPGYERPLG